MLPSFLSAVTQGQPPSASPPFPAIYEHSDRLGKAPASCLWWPPRSTSAEPERVLIFVPGNPGLCEFYSQFLAHIQENGPDTLAVLGHSLLGHSPFVPATPSNHSSLRSQVEAVIEVIDGLRDTFGAGLVVIIAGHSVGAWIVLQALKERRDGVSGACLLFPTISHIVRTPNGRRLSWLFRRPLPTIISYLSKLSPFVPSVVLSTMFRGWPPEQLQVLQSFIGSPSSVLASLTLAHEEMITIRDLDSSLLHDTRQRLLLIFAEQDDWVGSNKEIILREVGDEESASVCIMNAHHDIPHAYCINHGRDIADFCLKWFQGSI